MDIAPKIEPIIEKKDMNKRYFFSKSNSLKNLKTAIEVPSEEENLLVPRSKFSLNP
jgi:hypothetical protein